MSANIQEILDRYTVAVFWSSEDGAYIAVCPDFSGHSASGNTPEEAVREGRTALEAHIESYLENGERLPEPRSVSGTPQSRDRRSA